MEEDMEEVGGDDGYLLIRIHVPELNVQKCLQFPRDQLVWDVKQQCLAALPKVASWYRDLKESFNYGLFCPPSNGRAGKFLDEERRLGDYPFCGAVGYLELKYKRRVFKTLTMDEKQLKSLHTRANLRRLLDYVSNGQVEKIAKMCSKGIDPNFHCSDTGETPLTLATSTKVPGKTLMALVNGGALLDYRTRDGATALHRAVQHNAMESVKTLLELGASPNYKDAKGLTPLYSSVKAKISPELTEMLLRDHASIGAADAQGWREVHQACRGGLVTHLEHLIYYSADMNVQNASGNTPLHVCAVNNQESCARLLLFRGCDKEALNFANQTAYQVAVIAGNLDLAEIINHHSPEHVVPYRDTPLYRRTRRIGAMSEGGSVRSRSPTLSNHSSMCPTFSSSSSSVSGDSSNSASYLSHVTDKSVGDTSDVVSESSGVGTGSDTNSSLPPGSTVVCIEDYSSNIPGHLTLVQGEIIEITGMSEDGCYVEGSTRHQGSGLFPASVVEEVRMRSLYESPVGRVQGRREAQMHFATAPRLKKVDLRSEPRTVVLHRARKGFGFVLRGAKAASPLMELRPSDRCPGLQYLDDVDPGGVADRAGLKKGDYLLAINGEDVAAASHERVVELIRRSGELVQMTVLSLGAPLGVPQSATSSSVATLPRPATLGRRAPLPPRRDPNTSLSAGTAPRTASIRARPVSSRITAAELEELFQRQRGEPAGLLASSNFVAGSGPGSGPGSPKVYASVAEMKRSKTKGSKIRLFGSKKKSNMAELHREFHSTPDLACLEAELATIAKPHRSQEDVGCVLRPLPPSHPPPPPPTSQVVIVETRPTGPRGGILVSRGEVVTSRTSTEVEACDVMSSFRPTDNAKLYAQPEELKSVGYRARQSIRKSQSMRSPPTGGGLAGTEEARVPPISVTSATANSNPYAQPIRTVNRSRSSVSDDSSRAPPIPDPDYSLSESEGEEGIENKGGAASQESSGNSNTSGSSAGAVSHSFTLHEIQKVRTKLKSSRSYPNDFVGSKEEDGDNSSSGVSSDQDVAPDDSNHTFHRQNSIRVSNKQKMQIVNNLALLPPPLEEECAELTVLPPPMEFTEMEVLAPPPPQFSDGRLVTRVRVEHHPPH